MPNKVNVPALWSEQTGQVVAKQKELASGAFDTGKPDRRGRSLG